METVGGREILVVEDSPTQAARLEHLLATNGFAVRVAGSGTQALVLLGDRPADLVLTDIVMPEMDGYELCRTIKTDPRRAHIPVVLLTSLSDPTEVVKAIQVGADNFLTKPYQEELLVRRLRLILDNRSLRRETITGGPLPVLFCGQRYDVQASPKSILDLLLSTYEDAVTRHRQVEQANRELSRSLKVNQALQRSYSEALMSAADALVIVGLDGQVKFANRAALVLFGRPQEEYVGAAFGQAMTADRTVEIDILPPTGAALVAEMKVTQTSWEGELAYLASLRDITDTVRLRDELRTMAYSDELTELLNRRGFVTLADRELLNAQRSGRRLALFFIDLDGMKWINDNLGHAQGDLALIDAAEVLRQTFRKSDIIARLGGDEFAVMGLDLGPEDSQGLAQRIQQRVERRNIEAGRLFKLAMSIGVHTCRMADGLNMDQLLSQADAQMYEMKRARKNRRGMEPGGANSGEKR